MYFNKVENKWVTHKTPQSPAFSGKAPGSYGTKRK